MRLAVQQHLHALDVLQDAEIVYHNANDPPPRWLRYLRPDGVVLHATFLGVRWNDDFERYRALYSWVARFECPTVALPQDEYDHSQVLEEWLIELGATRVLSCFDTATRRVLYPRTGARFPFAHTLTGYIDGDTAAAIAPTITEPRTRPFDLVYRAAKLPYWFGSHGQLKHKLGMAVEESARERGLRIDVSTRSEDTIYGASWLDFVMSGRATVGCESGSSVLDPRGDLQARIREMLSSKPELTFEEVDEMMPAGWDSYAFFAISPRHLEAVITKTCQLLVEGSYSGVLMAGVHYVPLRRDLANLGEALDAVADVDAAHAIAERAYTDVYLNGMYTLAEFASGLGRVMSTHRRVRLSVATLESSNARAAAVERNLRATTAPLAQAMRTAARPFLLRARLWWTFAATLAGSPDLRRYLWHLVSGRSTPPLRRMVGDVIRLGLLARAMRPRPTMQWHVTTEVDRRCVVFRSKAGEGTSPVPPITAVSRVVWDHSAVASSVLFSPVRDDGPAIVLGSAGLYEFEIFRTSTLNAQALAARALVDALRRS